MHTVDNSVDVYVVGTGMVGFRQLTLEARQAIEASERVYTVHYQRSVLEHLAELTDEVIRLKEEYEERMDRRETYARMADRVIEGALEAEGPVTLALYGHPMVFVSPSRQVVEKAPDHDLTVDVRPGISSMDCLYCDFVMDPAERGIQMYEATQLLVHEIEVNPRVPLMLWQIGSVETVLYSSEGSHPERFTRIREYLQRFYPDDHEVKLAQTSTHPLVDSTETTFALSEFESMHDQINLAQTLYVPPAESPPVVNKEVARQAYSTEHLEKITQ